MSVDPPLDELHPTTPLREVALEVEAHVGEDGWDQPARLYALVPTVDLIAREPALAEQLGVDGEDDHGSLTSVEQDLPQDRDLEELLGAIEWPDAVTGCAVVVERVMLPPGAEEDLPTDPTALIEAVVAHPERREVRLVAAVLRDGGRHSIVRARTPEGAELLEGPDLVPGLLDSLHGTLT
ncbi:PPA1309 family protein [Aeromicrobium sp. CTD01-1L150]|uniref:PPA1309 family protein n=1 Tax=Aeromicrobium sp. CTD01-1L150 TaxID=3341830 RepID=UPI0035C06420